MAHELDILYEDDDLLALNKPRGCLVEGIAGGERSLSDKVVQLRGDKVRALHRLDRETTGIVLFAKNGRWNREWSALFERKRIRKAYFALTLGSWDRRIGRVDTNIALKGKGVWANVDSGGKPATTTFRLLKEANGTSWIEALPKTGRTHQIRLHCQAVGCPIVGDTLYGQSTEGPMMLHAHSVALNLPNGGKRIEISAALPGDWESWTREEAAR